MLCFWVNTSICFFGYWNPEVKGDFHGFPIDFFFSPNMISNFCSGWRSESGMNFVNFLSDCDHAALFNFAHLEPFGGTPWRSPLTMKNPLLSIHCLRGTIVLRTPTHLILIQSGLQRCCSYFLWWSFGVPITWHYPRFMLRLPKPSAWQWVI